MWYDYIIKNNEKWVNEETEVWYDDFFTKKRKRNDTARTRIKMGVTDKVVSKWEIDLSLPDINSIPKLADIFDISNDDLMQVNSECKEIISDNKVNKIID